jgi:retron-type reverse transcriptase
MDIEKDLRSISLTAVLSKTMERFVVKWIRSQIRQLFDLNQFGLLAGLSTTHALLSLVHHLYKVTDQRDQYVPVLLLDLGKSFDRINHNTLLTKMKDMAIDPTLIEWVRSLLTNRRQRVRVGNSASTIYK